MINTAKWVVAFLGSQKGLYNLDGMVHTHPSVNLLIICMMNSEGDKDNIKDVKELISKTNEGGFMIVRCRMAEMAENDVGHKDQMDIALEKIRNAIKLYPSKVVPIIQEELDF